MKYLTYYKLNNKYTPKYISLPVFHINFDEHIIIEHFHLWTRQRCLLSLDRVFYKVNENAVILIVRKKFNYDKKNVVLCTNIGFSFSTTDSFGYE